MTPHLRNAEGGTLILGGGFAGAYVARGLGRQGATIVNPANFMLYTPLLPEAAAGSIEPRHVTVPLRTMCPHADLLLGSVTALDTDAKRAHVSSESRLQDMRPASSARPLPRTCWRSSCPRSLLTVAGENIHPDLRRA